MLITGCEKQSNPMSVIGTDQHMPKGVQSLSDTIMDNWNNGESFLGVFKNGAHPDVVFEDSIGSYPYGDGSKLIFYFNGKRYQDIPYVPYHQGNFRPELLGGWINPNCYLLLVQTAKPVMYSGSSYNFYVITGQTVVKIQQIPKTINYGYHTGGIFEGVARINEVRKYNGDIILHGIEYISDQVFCKINLQNMEITNCYRKSVYPFTNWIWQW